MALLGWVSLLGRTRSLEVAHPRRHRADEASIPIIVRDKCSPSLANRAK